MRAWLKNHPAVPVCAWVTAGCGVLLGTLLSGWQKADLSTCVLELTALWAFGLTAAVNQARARRAERKLAAAQLSRAEELWNRASGYTSGGPHE